MSVSTSPFADRFAEWTPIAEGSEARIYRALDRWTRRVAALKVAEGDSAGAALTGEFRLLTTLRHPCLVRSEDLLVEGGTWAHSLEYVPAVAPGRVWDEGGEDVVRAALIQSLRALSYVHRRGMVHGDVAPGNVLIWGEGGRWRAKLADLGLTLPAEAAARSGVRGTPGYWAPEVARGEGLSGASDLYALAATAVAWIDGQGPWEGWSPSRILKEVSAGVPVPKPRRRVSPDLEALLGILGSADPEARLRWDWAELRRDESFWGPRTDCATVSGLDSYLEDWTRWAEELPEGAVGSLVLRGRFGTGRSTAALALGRSLVASGWAGLWRFPRWVGEAGAEATPEARDPVLIARELHRVLLDRHVVLYWPPHGSDAEARALRGFLAAREDVASRARTVVLKPASIETEDAELEWLAGATRARFVDWAGPGSQAIDAIRADLFPPEDGESPGAEFRADATPLALVVHKQASVAGSGESAAPRDGEWAWVEELARLWDRASAPSQQGLAILAWSDAGWVFEELASVLGWDPGTRETVLAEWNRLRLTRRRFEQGVPIDSLTDALTRRALVERAGRALTSTDVGRLVDELERGAVHRGDLGLAQRLVTRGQAIPRYLLASLETALGEGRFDEVLDVGASFDLTSEAVSRGAIRLVLTAAQQAGKYETEIAALRALLAGAPGAEVVELRKMLAQALANLGNWQEALDQCRNLSEAPEATPADRIWAGLQRAETLWQAGRFAEADTSYEAVSRDLSPELKAEWLRFAVGRARQHGQRGDMAGVRRYLDLAESTLGKPLCEQDPMYLNTLGGILIERAALQEAQPVLERARMLAFKRSEWNSYIMIGSRAATLTYDLGRMIDAAKLGRECVATAEALSSQRMLGFANTFQGYADAQLGSIGAASRRAQRVLDLSARMEDKNLELLGQRLRLFIASNVGWKREFESSVARAKDIAEGIGERGSLAFISHYQGIYYLGLEEFSLSEERFEVACRGFRETGQRGSEMKSRLLLCWAAWKRSGERENAEKLREVIAQIDNGESAALRPMGILARFDVDREFAQLNRDRGVSAVRDLWDLGRILDVIQWGPIQLDYCSGRERLEIRSLIVNAVQRVDSSLDDVQSKREFLSFPRVRLALEAVQQ